MDDVLDVATVARCAGALDEVFDLEDDIATERGWITDAYRVSHALPAKHQTFLDLCTHPDLLVLARSVLGEDCVLSGFNGLTTAPDGQAQSLHRDHPHATPGTTLHLHLVCALDPFTAENGATRLVAGSHDRAGPWSPTGDEIFELEPRAEIAVTRAGSVVGFDASVLHGSGANSTTEPRRALHVFFGRPWVQPHWDLTASLDPDVASRLGRDQRAILGCDRRPARFDRSRRRVVRSFEP